MSGPLRVFGNLGLIAALAATGPTAAATAASAQPPATTDGEPSADGSDHPPPPPSPQRVAKAKRDPVGPRYLRAPIDDGSWGTVIDEEVLVVLSAGHRICALIIEVTINAVVYADPEGELQTVDRSLVTAVQEEARECDTTSPPFKGEWVLPGTIAGSLLASAGLVVGVLADTGKINTLKTYALVAYPAFLFGAPLVGVAGYSAGYDRRVRGIPWARGLGWIAFSGAAISLLFSSLGFPGKTSRFGRPGLASAAGGLGFLSAGLLGLDGLRSRAEFRALPQPSAGSLSTRRGPVPLQSLRLGLTPLVAGGQVHGVGFGVAGRLGGG